MKIITFLLTILLSLSAKGYGMDLRGQLIFDQGTALYCLDLQTLSKTKLVQFPGHIALSTYITKSGDSVIISEAGTLKSIALRTQHVTGICEGVMPCYIEKHKALFFYAKEEGNKCLFVRRLNREQNAIKIMTFPVPPNTDKKYKQRPPIPITDDEIILLGKNLNLWIYNLATNKLKDLKITNCIPHAFISKTNQLLCETFSQTRNYQLLSLDDMSTEALNISEYDTPLVYIPSNNVLVYKTIGLKFPFSEVYPIMVLDFKTGSKEELLSNEYMHSAVWMSD